MIWSITKGLSSKKEYNEEGPISRSALHYWGERGDSNPHGFTRQILSLVRLPIPPLSHVFFFNSFPAFPRRRLLHCRENGRDCLHLLHIRTPDRLLLFRFHPRCSLLHHAVHPLESHRHMLRRGVKVLLRCPEVLVPGDQLNGRSV